MLKSFVAGIGIFLAGLFGTHQVQPAAPVPTYPPAAHVAIQEAPGTAHPTVPAATPLTSQPTTIINQPVIKRIIERAMPAVFSGVTKSELDAQLQELTGKFTTQLAGIAAANAAAPNNFVTVPVFAQAGRIDNLANVSISNATVHGVSGLTASDIPSLSYLPLSGGTITGDLTVSGAVSGGSLSLSVASTSNLVATNATSTNFFATLGHFTTGIIDSLTATAATITNLIVTTITGTNAAFTNATTTNATSTNLYVSGAVTLGSPLSVSNGGTGWNNINTGSILFGNGSSVIATSSSLFWDNANGRLGIGTTSPYARLSVTGIGTGSGISFQTADANNNPAVTILDNGLLSVGTSTMTSLWESEPLALVFEGDSNTANATVGWQTLMTRYFPLAATSSDWALSGDTCANMVGEYPSQAGSIAASYGEKAFFLNCGTIDVNGGSAAATIYSNIKSIWASARASGYKVIAFTVPPSTLFDGTKEATRQSLNTLIKSDPTLYDGLVNIGDVLTIGMMNSSTWSVDGTHYYTSAGSAMVAQLAFQAAYAKVQTTGIAAQTIGTWALNTGSLTVSSTTGTTLLAGSLTVGNKISVGTSSPTNSSSPFVAVDSFSGGSFEVGNLLSSAPVSIYPGSSGNFPALSVFRNGSRTNIAFTLSLVGNTPTFNSTNADFVFQKSSTEKLRTGANGATVSNGDAASSFIVTYATSSLPNNQQIGGVYFSFGMPDSAVSRAAIIAQQTGGLSVQSATDLQFYTSPRNNSTLFQRMIIQSNGNVGIGTTSPYALLSVSNSASTAANTPLFVVASTTGGTATTTVFTIASTGDVTITGSAATCTLGNGASATSCSSSDQRLKDDITTIDASNSLAAVEALRPVSFKWNQWMVGNGAATSTQFGFIAQEIMNTFPNLVTLDSNSHYYKLDYQGLFAPIVGAVQALAQRVTDFADSFTTKELTFTRATGDDLTLTHQLCIQKSDGTPVCVTGDQLAAALGGTSAGSSGGSSDPSDSGDTPTRAPDTTPPTITINGANPANIHVNDSYVDLGATVTDNADQIFGLKYFLNGTLVSNIVIDTSAAATDTIDYVATDNAGNTATSTRTVIVESPATAEPAPTP